MSFFVKPVTAALIALTLATGLGMVEADDKVDAGAIKHLMMTPFDKPESPLSVNPATVMEDIAVVGWVQGDSGGRCCKRSMGNGRSSCAEAMR